MMKLSGRYDKLHKPSITKYLVTLSVLLCFSLCPVLLSGCIEDTAANEKAKVSMTTDDLLDPVSVALNTAIVKREDIFTVVQFDSAIEPVTTELSFHIRGSIDLIQVHLGEEVKKGQVLATLETEAVEESIRSMEEKLEDMKAQHAYELQDLTYQIEIDQESRYYTTSPAIRADNHYIEEEMLTLKQKMQRYALEEKQLQEQIDDVVSSYQKYQLTAPFDGRIMAVADLYKGDAIMADKPVIVMLPSNPEYFLTCDYFNKILVDRSDRIYALIKGQEYDVSYQPYTNDEMARIRGKEQPLKSRFSINDENGEIQIGDYALLFVIQNWKRNVLTIPKDAIFYDSEGSFVYLVEQNSRVRHAVTAGVTSSTTVEIEEGLQEGDVIYVKN